MFNKPLAGLKVAIIVENKFIPEEIQAYRSGFSLLGASVDFISRIWYGDYKPGNAFWKPPVFYSDVDPGDQQPWQGPESITVPDNNDVSRINLDDYAAVVMSANYVSVRLRYSDDPNISDPRELVRSAPMVKFFAEAMNRPGLVKGALCHGLWILTPNPDLLKERRVTCHTMVMADILNCGAEMVFEDTADSKRVPAKVVTDRDLVTGFSKHEVVPFIKAIAVCILKLRGQTQAEDLSVTAQQKIITLAATELADMFEKRFNEAQCNLVSGRPVAAAAGALLDGSLDVAAEVLRVAGVKLETGWAAQHKPVLLVASKFGTWASELTLVAGTLLKAGYKVRLATEDGSPPHLLGPSMVTGTPDGAWGFPVVSDEERDLAVRFLKPGTRENVLFQRENIVNLGLLAKPPQVGDYLKNHGLLATYRETLKSSMGLALEYDALCVAGGSGAIPGLMFDRGLHALILAFHKLKKPIMGECNGGLAILQTLDPVTGLSILSGRAVTTHSMLDEYQSGWGWTQSFGYDTASFWRADGTFDLAAYCAAETWYQPGMTGNPLVDSELAFRNAAGADGLFFSPAGSPYSVVVDGHIITCRTTPDGYPGVLCLMAALDGVPPLRGRLFIQHDDRGRERPGEA